MQQLHLIHHLWSKSWMKHWTTDAPMNWVDSCKIMQLSGKATGSSVISSVPVPQTQVKMYGNYANYTFYCITTKVVVARRERLSLLLRQEQSQKGGELFRSGFKIWIIRRAFSIYPNRIFAVKEWRIPKSRIVGYNNRIEYRVIWSLADNQEGKKDRTLDSFTFLL